MSKTKQQSLVQIHQASHDHAIDRALHNAVRAQRYQLIKPIVDAGADINSYDETGIALIHKAAEQGNVDLFRILLETGATMSLLTQYGTKSVIHHAKMSKASTREKFLVFFDTQNLESNDTPVSQKKLLKAFYLAFDIKQKEPTVTDQTKIEDIKTLANDLERITHALEEASKLGLLDQALTDTEASTLLNQAKTIQSLLETKGCSSNESI